MGDYNLDLLKHEIHQYWLVYPGIISAMPNIFFKIPWDIQKYIQRIISCDEGKNTE